MSLVDALLLEPPKFDVWIALRTDGVLGSGTQSDPYDGSAIKTPPLQIALSRTGILAETTLADHGFAVNDVIVVSRATNPADGDWWDGTFTVREVIDQNRFTYVMQREPLSSSPTGDYVRRVQKYLAFRFDDLMRDETRVPPKTTVHIGPGVFETRGRAEGEAFFPPQRPPPPWRPRNGQRILGAGMGLTTLKLVAAYAPVGNRKAAVIWSEELLDDGLEVGDMTIDCNAEGQPSWIAPDGGASSITAAPINIMGGGRHIYIHRVRAINFASRVREFYSENMVLYISTVAGKDFIDAVFEDCVAEFPSANNAANSFLIQVAAGGEAAVTNPVGAEGLGLVIRNCYVDGRNNYGPVVPIQSVSFASGKVTLVTKVPHGHRKPGNLIVSGIAVGGSFSNGYNGIFVIDEIVNDTTLKYTPIGTPPAADSPPGGTIGGLVSSTDLAIKKIEAVPDPNNPGQNYPRQLKLTTFDPHQRTTNNLIHIKNVYKDTPNAPKTIGSTALHYKLFPIVKYDPAEPKVLEFTIYQDLDIPLDDLDLGWGLARQGHVGVGADNGIVEGTHISHVGTGGPYQDTFLRRSTMARDNYYHDVSTGLSQLLLGTSYWSGSIIMDSLDYDDSELVCPTLALHSFAELENSIIIGKLYTTEPAPPDPNFVTPWVPRHGFIKKPAVGDPDYVNIVTAGGPDANLYLGAFAVLDTPDSRTFTYEANGTVTTKAGGPTYRPHFPNGNRGLRPIESMTATQVGSVWKIRATVRRLYQTAYPVNHGLQAGDIVNVTNAGVHPNHSGVLNGFFKITAVESGSDPSWFEYEVSQNPNISGEFSPGYYGRMWGLDYCLAEANIIELDLRTMGPEAYNAPAGIFLYGGGAQPEYRMRQVVLRDNLIRSIDNRPDAGVSEGVRMEAALLAEKALWQNNVVRLNSDALGGTSLTYAGSQLITFHNTTSEGKLIRARDRTPPLFPPGPELTVDIQTAIEDAITASLLR